MPITLGILAQSRQVVDTGAFQLLETVSVGTAVASVTFSSLGTYASTYKHLQIRLVGRTTRAVTEDGATRIFLNGDTTLSNYRGHFLVGTGSTVVSFDEGNVPALGSFPAANAGANQFAPMVIDLPDAFTTTKNKTMRMLAGSAGSVNSIRLHSVVRFNTASTTQIDLNTASGNWAIGTRISLYGVKATA
jgi:hypothetical protein